jgi:hypothetical protein
MRRLWLALACAMATASPRPAASAPRSAASTVQAPAGAAAVASVGVVTYVRGMPLPGGIAGLARVLRIEAPPDRARLLVDIIRRLYNLSLDAAPTDDRRQLEGYFATLSELQRALSVVQIHSAAAGQPAQPGQGEAVGRSDGVLVSLKTLDGGPSAGAGAGAGAATGAGDRRADGERLLRALGARLVEDAAAKGRTCALDDERAAVAKRGYLAAAGVEVEAVVRSLNAGDTVSIALARDEMPLPLGVAAWRRAVFAGAIAESEIAAAILLQRRPACFYHALASLDEPTLAYLDAHPDFLAALFQRRAEVLTTFGRSVHILDGRIIVPGGNAAAPLWEALLEHSVAEPEAFIDALLARDAGRFAFFYDTVAHVPEPVRHLVLRERADPRDGPTPGTSTLTSASTAASASTSKSTSASTPTSASASTSASTSTSTSKSKFKSPSGSTVSAAATAARDEAIERLRKLAHVFDSVSPTWRVVEAPMWRPSADPATWLGEVQLSATGDLAASFTRHAWDEIFRSDSVTGAMKAAARADEKARKQADREAPARATRAKGDTATAASSADSNDRAQTPADIGWLAERTFLDDPAQQRERYEMTLWAQRLFANVGPASSDLTSAIVACRGFVRFETLLLTLERMDIRDPAIYRDAVVHAATIANSGGAREHTSLALYEASLALIERLRLSRRLDAATAGLLVHSLAQLPLDDQEPFALTAWIDDRLTPAISGANRDAVRVAAADAAADLESRLLDALGGGAPVSPSADLVAATSANAMVAAGTTGRAPHVQWEGQSYRVDLAAAERARMAVVRRGQDGPSLDAALSAFRSPGAPGAIDGTSGEREQREKARRDVKSERQAASVLAEVLVRIVYASHLPGDRPELLQNAPWRRHDFGLDVHPETLRRRLAWRQPEELTGGGIAWHLRGSLLALDLALAPYHLRRISDDPPAPTINEGDRTSATTGVALLNPFDVTDEDRDQLVATIARGRAAIAAQARDPAALLTLARRAGFSEWRLQALRWTLGSASRPAPASPVITEALAASRASVGSSASAAAGVEDAVAAFAIIDQFWAGEPDLAMVVRLDRWGPSVLPLTGQLATRLPRARAWEDFAGRLGSGIFVTQIADVHLQTASFLAARGLPASLYRGAMAAAVQDFVDHAPARHFDDWSALVMYARTLPASRFEDYVAALTVEGPLRALADDAEDHK